LPSTGLALLAADFSREFKLAMADAIIDPKNLN
jgi:hypothetical protein